MTTDRHTSGEPARRPHILLILTDDHAAHAVGAYGSRINTTPHIDGIAERGVRLDRCFVTNSLCTPSRASILTGTYSHVNGVRTLSTPIDPSQPTFVSLLKEAGYRTGLVGKWHLGEGLAHQPQGFDHWEILVDQGEYVDPTIVSPEGTRTEPGYATDVLTDLALGWLDSLDGDEPWCLLLWHKAPHRPWIPAPRHTELFTDPIPLPETFEDDHTGRSEAVQHVWMSVAEHLNAEDLKVEPPAGLAGAELTRWKYQRWMEDYLRCVEAVDESVGRVVDALTARGELDDTVLAYSSDQGFFLGDHGWFDKRLMFEESIRMPLVLSWPRGLPGGGVHDGIVSNVDLAPTILEACGVPAHPRMQGRSFWRDLVGGDAPPPADGLYYRYWEHADGNHHAPAHYGYRTERHKLVYYYNDPMGLPGTTGGPGEPEWELYDLRADPAELRNVADDPAYADVREELEARMWRAQAELGDGPHPSQPVPRLLG
ncbi:sulfatase [uncultured Serinicoccus sp.]|uniref:sulfatase family protein n=1 Tax=uncultured Serinicoccus sp. TaxID=735514 RepID=UPI0026052132|nr:sulfatase [uncultured Serinicoccus sp.]